jgi:hypothetical protein
VDLRLLALLEGTAVAPRPAGGKNIMVKIARCFMVGGCVLAMVACNRDRLDRDGSLGTNDRPIDRPNVGVPADRDRNGTPDRDRSGLGTTDHGKGGVGTTTVTGANVGAVANDSAITRIVGARCERETSCRNVGADKRFASGDVCRQKLRAEMRDDLNANDCPKGIDAKELNECLEAIHKEDCNNPIDAISRVAACRTSDLCLKTDAPNR